MGPGRAEGLAVQIVLLESYTVVRFQYFGRISLARCWMCRVLAWDESALLSHLLMHAVPKSGFGGSEFGFQRSGFRV